MTNPFIDDSIFKVVDLASQTLPAPALFVVGLPIGNLGDITLRALYTLNQVDAIGAEDTRQTLKLLDKFNIAKPLFSVHQHNEHQGAEKIIAFLKEGKRVAIVTDAGTPAVSDPGSKVVDEVQKKGFLVVPIPGASAVVTAMSAAGMAPEGFVFQGFLTGGAKERLTELLELYKLGKTFVLYEAPHRILRLAEELSEVIKDNRKIVICRELTKKFETIETLKTSDLKLWSAKHSPKGEYVVIVNAANRNSDSEIDPSTQAWLNELSEQLPTRQLALIASKISDLPKGKLYDYILTLKESSKVQKES